MVVYGNILSRNGSSIGQDKNTSPHCLSLSLYGQTMTLHRGGDCEKGGEERHTNMTKKWRMLGRIKRTTQFNSCCMKQPNTTVYWYSMLSTSHVSTVSQALC